MTGQRAPARVKVEGDMFHGRVPVGAVYVGRGLPGLPRSPWANPYSTRAHGLGGALRLYRAYLLDRPDLIERGRAELAGLDLACWCPLARPCHADLVLDLVNEPQEPGPVAA